MFAASERTPVHMILPYLAQIVLKHCTRNAQVSLVVKQVRTNVSRLKLSLCDQRMMSSDMQSCMTTLQVYLNYRNSSIEFPLITQLWFNCMGVNM